MYRLFFSGKPDLNRKQLSVNKICKMKKSLLTEDHSDIINKGLKETAFQDGLHFNRNVNFCVVGIVNYTLRISA